jgi:hypothetical protein
MKIETILGTIRFAPKIDSRSDLLVCPFAKDGKGVLVLEQNEN